MKQKGKIEGVYYHKLNKIFISITFVALTLLILYSCLFFHQQKKETDIIKANLAINKIQVYSTNFEIIKSKIDMFSKSDKLLNWIESDNTIDKGFALIKLYKDITLRTSILGDMDYSLTVIDPLIDKVVCSGGTYSIKDYLANESEMEYEHLYKIINTFESSDVDIMLPIYDEKNKLGELYHFTKIKVKHNYVVVVATINMNDILQSQKDINVGFVSSSGDIIELIKGSFDNSNKTKIIHLADKTNLNDINIIDNQFFLKQLKGLPWTIVIEMVPNNIGLIYFAVILFIIILLITWFIYLVGMKAKIRLYSPIKDIVDNTENSKDLILTKNIDEFAFIKSMNDKVHILSEELSNVLEKQEKLIAQKYTLGLIEGRISEEDKKDRTNFFVGYMDFDNIIDESNKQLLMKLGLELSIVLDENILSLRKQSSKVVFIIKAETREKASIMIKQLLGKLGEDSEIQVALSDLVVGKCNLQKAFNQVQSLYEYHYSFPSRRIITSDDLNLLSFHSYYYPVHIEKRLVSMLIEGNLKYKGFLSKIIEENRLDKNLTPFLKHDFVISLVSSIRRVFQEIKTTPENLIGHKIDWHFFNQVNNFENEVTVIYNICDEIVKSINESSNKKDSQMLSLIIDFIHTHFMDDIKLQDVADLLNITPKYAGILFSSLSDMNFKTYLTNYRVERAKEIIKNQPKIKVIELSSMVGFNSSNSLIRAFNKELGMTPKNYANLINRNCR